MLTCLQLILSFMMGTSCCLLELHFVSHWAPTAADAAGICQTSGDLIAAVMLRTQKALKRPDLDECRGNGVHRDAGAIRGCWLTTCT